jgi:nicotinamide-nucleotide amidase
MIGEVIATGDELASGQRLDTNSQWLSQRLSELGVRVLYHTTVGDDRDAEVRAYREAFQRADVVVSTGGLGPTADDLVREALAAATGVDLVRDDEALAQIRGMFARRQREMPERNVVQAMFPRGSRPLRNPHGTAPGIALEIRPDGEKVVRVFALPGVPAEMHEMWDRSVAPAVRAAQGARGRVIRHRRIHCFGAGESHIEQMLPDLVRRGREPTVGITASKATITLRVTATGTSAGECERAMAPTLDTIRKCLGSLVFGEDGDELQHAVARLLRERGLTLATAEWGTTGLVAQWLAGLRKSSEFYRGGLVQAAGPQSPPDSETAPGANPTEEDGRRMVKQLAVAIRQQFDADLGLAAGNFPPWSGAENSPPQLVMALALADGVELGVSPYAAHPEILSQLSAKRALDFVRLYLRSLD